MKDYKIPESRLRHCYGVAFFMKDMAKNYFRWDDEKCKEMFILGLLHDAGYEFVTGSDEDYKHSSILADVLKNNGYKYSNEIMFHNSLTKEYHSDELDLLWLADMSVDSNGKICSLHERLLDIENRHGKDSKISLDSREIINYLEKRFW